ncbi:MAG: PEP/pyruvate-binding domain-containing protein [bacterium]
MGIIIQQIAGRQYDDLYYPDFSGVARTINFFPVSNMKREDGVAYVALGLGKSIMEGQNVLQFSPKHPDILPQLVAGDFSIKNSQRDFYAIDLSNPEKQLNWNENITLRKEQISRAEKDGTLDLLGSTYDVDNDMVHDGIHHKGLKFVSFAHILKSNLFPLCDLLIDVLDLGKSGLGSTVEIEFAVDLAKNKGEKHKFYFLQIRPMISDKEQSNIDVSDIPQKRILVNSSHSLGNGLIKGITDVVYVRPNDFNAANTPKIAEEVGKINETIKAKALFIGIGRWGTSDPWLGIPVNWGQISKAKVMIEVALDNFNIDPSHGSHFFHNITSLGIGYFTIPANSYDEFIDWSWLDQQSAIYETELVRHVKLSEPLEVILNGRKGKGTILKPLNSL